jgi:hypothetical protein
MPLLNYTTTVLAEKTVGEIQKCLASHGARAILSEYDAQGAMVALSFKILVEGHEIAFRLPTDWRPVLRLLETNSKVPKRLKGLIITSAT